MNAVAAKQNVVTHDQTTATLAVLRLAGNPALSSETDLDLPRSPNQSPEHKRAYPAPAELPTQEGTQEIRFDFNDGCRVMLPESKHPWWVRLSDLDSGNVLFDTEMNVGRVNSTKRYFVRIRLEVWQHGKRVFSHDYSATNRDVLVQFPIGTLGDTLGWFPYAVKFKENHRCRLTCAMSEKLIPLFRDAYPEITFVTHEEVKPERYYATYSMGLFFDDKDFMFQPCDFRYVGLHRTAGYILGVDPTEVPPKIALADDSRPIAERYVCIGVQSTTQAKYWNNPTGWYQVIEFLKNTGYRVICIDQRPVHGTGLVWNHIPHGVEDQTGTSRCRSEPVGSSTLSSSSDYRAGCLGWRGQLEPAS
jgi:autotransporter strand-loop-strand O-heptosyltransferase